MKPFSKNQSGQGLIEYLIIVAIMGVATMAIVRVVGQSVATKFAKVAAAIQGRTLSAENPRIEESQYKKRDLGDFFEGAASRDP